MNTLSEAEIMATVVLFVVIWMVIPWNPLSASEAVLAVLSVVALAGGIVALVEYAIREVIGR